MFQIKPSESLVAHAIPILPSKLIKKERWCVVIMLPLRKSQVLLLWTWVGELKSDSLPHVCCFSDFHSQVTTPPDWAIQVIKYKQANCLLVPETGHTASTSRLHPTASGCSPSTGNPTNFLWSYWGARLGQRPLCCQTSQQILWKSGFYLGGRLHSLPADSGDIQNGGGQVSISHKAWEKLYSIALLSWAMKKGLTPTKGHL